METTDGNDKEIGRGFPVLNTGKVALPRFDNEGELLKFLMRENVPGSFPCPIIDVNTFVNPRGSGVATEIELARSIEDEKQSQLKRITDFQKCNAGEAKACLAKLRHAVIDNGNVFAVMMDPVRHCSLGRSATRSTWWVGSTGAACKSRSRLRGAGGSRRFPAACTLNSPVRRIGVVVSVEKWCRY
jgi:hypothetical protein